MGLQGLVQSWRIRSGGKNLLFISNFPLLSLLPW